MILRQMRVGSCRVRSLQAAAPPRAEPGGRDPRQCVPQAVRAQQRAGSALPDPSSRPRLPPQRRLREHLCELSLSQLPKRRHTQSPLCSLQEPQGGGGP